MASNAFRGLCPLHEPTQCATTTRSSKRNWDAATLMFDDMVISKCAVQVTMCKPRKQGKKCWIFMSFGHKGMVWSTFQYPSKQCEPERKPPAEAFQEAPLTNCQSSQQEICRALQSADFPRTFRLLRYGCLRTVAAF